MALDASWNCDASALSWANNMANFFNSKGTGGIQQGFYMNGNTLGGGDSLCFIAMSAASMMPAQSDATIKTWWSAALSTTAGAGYFCDTLQMISLTYMAGLMPMPDVA